MRHFDIGEIMSNLLLYKIGYKSLLFLVDIHINLLTNTSTKMIYALCFTLFISNNLIATCKLQVVRNLLARRVLYLYGNFGFK